LDEQWTGQYYDSFIFIEDEGPLESNIINSGDFSFQILKDYSISGTGSGKIDGVLDYMDSHGCKDLYQDDITFSVSGQFDPKTAKARVILSNMSDFQGTFACDNDIEISTEIAHAGFAGYWIGQSSCPIQFNDGPSSYCTATRFEIDLLPSGSRLDVKSSDHEGVSSTIEISRSSGPDKDLGKAAVIVPSEAGTTKFRILAQNETFDVLVVGDGINTLDLDQTRKSLIFSNNGTGTVEISIPKTLLGGNITVFEQDDVPLDFELTETDTASNIILNTNADISKIRIQGTTVIPEFTIPIMLAIAAMSLVLVARWSKGNYFTR
jgi:hypothetical protein